jgi:hypothetical protein
MNKNSKFVQNLKRQAEENPLVALGVGIALLTAAGKFIDANTARKAANTHALEVARRVAVAANR